MKTKLKVKRTDIIGASIYDLAFIIQSKLMEGDYLVARNYQRQIFQCKNPKEMLTTICSYAEVA